jgi:hypothetical protein
MLSWIASTPLLSSRRLAPVAVTTLFVFVAVLGGVVIGSGNFVLMAVVLGALVGGLLIGSVGIVVWVVLIGALLVSGPLVMNFPELKRLPWLFSMLGLLLAAASTLYIGSGRSLSRNAAPAFVGMAIAFLLYILVNAAIGDGVLDEKLTAMKRWFQYLGVMFIFATAPFTPKQVKRWALALFLIALVQLPFALHQRIVLVPLRANMPERVVPIDIVAGTFEAEMWGGANNNTMAYFLLVAAVGLLSAYRDRAISGLKLVLMLAVVGIPLGLGETKMVLVFLPIAFLAAYGDLVRKRPGVFALASLAASGVIVMFIYVYVGLHGSDGDGRSMTIDQRVAENLEYNVGTTGYYGGGSLNRSTAVPFWWSQHGLNDPVATVIGHGIGASFTSQTDPGHIDRKYAGYSVGLTGLTTLLWDVGILGAALYMSVLLAAGLTGIKLLGRTEPGLDRAVCRALIASVFMHMALVPVADMMFQAPSTELLQALTLGLIAWRWRSRQPL